ncbi:ATP-dependent DNA helicase RecG [Carnobacteriaceae bacterium zg-ZUI78]|nr:ATP-dependent DNA helicase RecG [Carnobacteriaceae bacterium zg-ZUI78]
MKSIYDRVDTLKSVGPKRVQDLNQLGIETVEDLLLHFPFRYEDIQIRDLTEVLDQDKISLKGTILTDPVVSFYAGRKNRLSFRLGIGAQVINVVFFNQHYLKDKCQIGLEIAIYGKWEEKRQTLLGMKLLGTANQNTEFSAVYHTTKSMKQATLVKLIKQSFDDYKDVIEEVLPDEILDKYAFMDYMHAIENMHFPENQQSANEARRRMIYQELFFYQLKLNLLKYERHKTKTGSLKYDTNKLKAYIDTIPFSLTNAQKKVSNDICRDLLAPFDMNRLLQGDVGSGKTVVASIAIAACVFSGKQVAFMVPTEILAQQHYKTIQTLFQGTSIKVGLLTSSTTVKERKQMLLDVLNGQLDCLIGTHALIQEDIQFYELGLIIIDEQHRFGVMQRQKLKEKAIFQNVLYMTATPIPRTLSMTLFGEMDVSVIDELPAGRQKIITRWVKEQEMEKVLEFMKREIDKGYQAYMITPLIEESEALEDVQNAQKMYEYISEYFYEYSVGLLHGKMKADEKDDVMKRFKQNNIHILVSTTVIEVGVDVPNATIMVIQDAERFGLAQLHQLRGRVGRGDKQSYCILVANPKTEQGKQRMAIMVESQDGFYLSQKDLEMRGTGDIFGLKQSGIPDFSCADIIRDVHILNQARQDAMDIVHSQNPYIKKAYELLRKKTFDKIKL